MSLMSRPLWILLTASSLPLAALAQPSSSGLVYTCVSNGGRTLTADRPIAECMDREQRVLRRDGSLDRVILPPLSPQERAAKEQRERRAAEDKRAKLEAERLDRNLLQRFPDAAAHDKARQEALRSATEASALSQRRLAELASERKPLEQEAEFYKGKPLPAKLRQQLSVIDASTEAQRAALQNLKAEIDRVNGVYDEQRVRLKQLWGGAAPGSPGPLAAAKTDAPAR